MVGDAEEQRDLQKEEHGKIGAPECGSPSSGERTYIRSRHLSPTCARARRIMVPVNVDQLVVYMY